MSMTITSLLGLLLRHGQHLLVYPAAFENPVMRLYAFCNPASCGLQYMAPLLKTSDGVDLSCFLIPQTRESLDNDNRHASELEQDERVELTPAAAEARATVIVFHGNAMHNFHDMHSPTAFFKMKCNVNRYSFSGGTPSEAGLRIDAQTALNYILSQPYLAQVPVIVYGHSLGGGVAIDLARRNPTLISGVLVSNTFTSIPDIVRTWPVIGAFSFVCTQKWRSKDKLCKISVDTPILMISGRNDEVIPAHLMDKLWEAAQNRGISPKSSFPWSMKLAPCSTHDEGTSDSAEAKPKPAYDKFVRIPYGTHNSTPTNDQYWSAIRKFVKKVGKLAEHRPRNDPPPEVKYTQPDVRWQIVDAKFVVVPPPDDKDNPCSH